MQSGAITVNAAGITAEGIIQGSRPQMKPEKNIFGAECRVTISREGKRLSRQQAAGPEERERNARSELLLRRQNESGQDNKASESWRAQLDEIDQKIRDLSNSYNEKKDSEKTIEKQQEVLRAMRAQKQFQMEENQRRAKEAQEMALESGEYQENIDKNNRDLLTLLKTMEEAKKAEEEQEGGEVKGNGSDRGLSDGKALTGGGIQNSAAQFMAASMKHALNVEEAIDGLGEEGHLFLNMADSIARGVLRESANIRAAIDDESFTDERTAQMMEAFREEMAVNYKDIEDFRGWGLQILQDARECRIQHIADDPLRGMQETKRSMVLSAADAAWGEATQGILNDASRQIEEEVERLIDERNNGDRIWRDTKEDEDEDEQTEEEEMQDL